MPGATDITYVGVLVHEECCTCGIAFGMTEDFMHRRRNDHKSFYCPSGHGQHYTGKSDATKLREAERMLGDERRRLQATRDLLAAEERSHASTRGHVTRKKKELSRVHAGVCPVEGCRRHFTDLGRHMKTKHPEIVT